MSWGKRDKKEVPRTSDFAMVAYAERLEPKVFVGRRIDGKIANNKPFGGIFDIDELERQVGNDSGGGSYVVQFFEEANKKNYLGQHRFTLAGDPLIGGEPIEPTEDDKTSPKKKKDKDDPVGEIEVETEVERARMNRDRVLADRKKLRAETGLDDDDEGGYEEEGGTAVTLLREEMSGLKDTIAEQGRQRELERRDERYDRMVEDAKASREQQAQLMQTVLAALSAKPSDTGSKQAFEAQMKAMEAMISSSQQSTQAILQAQESSRKESQSTQTKMMELVSGKSDSMLELIIGSMKEQNQSKLESAQALAEAKSSNAQDVLGLLKDTWQTAMQMGMGKSGDEEDRPTGPMDLIDRISDRLTTVVTNFMALKGQQTPISKEEISAKIRETAEAVAAEATSGGIAALPSPVSKEIEVEAALAGSPMPDRAPAQGVAATTVPPRSARKQRAQTPGGGGGLKAEPIPPRARDGMNAVLREFIKTVNEGKKLDNWMNSMLTRLPSYVVLELNEAKTGTPMEFIAVLRKYGDPVLVEQAIAKLGEYQQHQAEIAAKKTATATPSSSTMPSLGQEEPQTRRPKPKARRTRAPRPAVKEPGTPGPRPVESESTAVKDSEADRAKPADTPATTDPESKTGGANSEATAEAGASEK